MAQIACPHCGQCLSLPDEFIGRQVRCAACQAVFQATDSEAPPHAAVPQPVAAPPSSAASATPFAFDSFQETSSAQLSFRRSRTVERVASLMQAAVAMDVLIAALFFVNLMLARDQLSGTVAGPLMLVGSMVSFLVLVLLFVSAKMLGQQRYGPMVVVASAIFLLIAFGVFCAAAALGIALLKVPAIHWSWRLLYPVLVLLCYVIGFLLNVAAGFKSLILVTRRPEGA